MTDIVTRLRRWVHAVDSVSASDLMDEAADEIERLRKAPCPYVVGTTTQYCSLTPPTLTDEERQAIEAAADFIDAKSYASAATLRSLLERTK